MIDVISDLHTEKYVSLGMSIGDFVLELLPEKLSDILIIAGDIADDNKTSESVLTELCEYYKKVIVVFGNHDLYLPKTTLSVRPEFKKRTPLFRWEALKNQMKKQEKVIFLDGDVFSYQGISIGGTGGWYDLSYTINHLSYSISEAESEYENFMQDTDAIPNMKKFNWEFFYDQYRKLLEINQKVDIMVTHVCPTSKFMAPEFRGEALSGCFSFDGEQLLNDTTAKIWLSGHTHTNSENKWDEVRLINQALGYPNEPKLRYDLIKTIQI